MSSEWPIVTVSSICTIFDGPHATPKKTGTGPVFLGISNLSSGRLDFSSTEFLSEDDFIKWTKRVTPREGDVVFSYETRLGQAAIVPAGLRCCLGRRMALMRVNPTVAIPEFVLYAFLSPEFQDVIRQRTIHGSTVDRIPLIEFGNFPIRIPPLHVQREVVGILKAVDDRIALLRETNATLESVAQAVFKSWFVDFDPVRAKQKGQVPEGMDEATAALFPESFDESKFGQVPKGWHAATLGSICAESGGAIQTGPFGSQLHASDYRDVGIPVVMPQDLAGRRVQVHKIARVGEADARRLIRHQLQRGDIVFSRRGDVGRHALVGEREVGWLCGTGCLLVRPGQTWPSFTYLSLALDCAVAKEWLLRHAVGATMPNLNTGILSAVPIMRPDDRTLHAFDAIIRALDERISHGHSHIRTLVDLRDTLLPRLISGQLRLSHSLELMKHAA